MTFQAAVDQVAQRMTTVDGMLRVYASNTSGISGVYEMPDDIPDTPACKVTHNGFSLDPGSFERIFHDVLVELYFLSATPAVAEQQLVQVLEGTITAFRDTSGMTGFSGPVRITVGGPPGTENINGKDYSVYPVHVSVAHHQAATYTGPPTP